MSSNMLILWQNCLMQYQTFPIAAKAWVWFAETRGHGMLYKADEYANEVKQLVEFLSPNLQAAGESHKITDEQIDDLLKFILRRHANYRLGGNVLPDFLQ